MKELLELQLSNDEVLFTVTKLFVALAKAERKIALLEAAVRQMQQPPKEMKEEKE